ncbi:MAG: hypothetical protein FWE74_03250, partial [Oscillospiraceae bacterium]|nr:hypothetical protein [Oscillospiraceae bacterium]
MYRNAFEELKAATDYGSRGIAQQIKQLLCEGVPKEETEPHRLYLLKPENYLFDELMTVRGADYSAEADSQKNDEYMASVRLLVGCDCVPISVSAAYGWYCDLEKYLSESTKTKAAIHKIIRNNAKSDPWVLQGMAAVLSRAAIILEIESPAKAPAVWESAFSAWIKFFTMTDVKSS